MNADHLYFYLKVEDNGMSIPEESLKHLRFYRVDKSHSREIGNFGVWDLPLQEGYSYAPGGAIKASQCDGRGHYL